MKREKKIVTPRYLTLKSVPLLLGDLYVFPKIPALYIQILSTFVDYGKKLGLRLDLIRKLPRVIFPDGHRGLEGCILASMWSSCSLLFSTVPRRLYQMESLIYSLEEYFSPNSFTGLRGAKFICFQDRQWHSECFNCGKCSVSLVGEGFLTQNNEIFCRKCGSGLETDI